MLVGGSPASHLLFLTSGWSHTRARSFNTTVVPLQADLQLPPPLGCSFWLHHPRQRLWHVQQPLPVGSSGSRTLGGELEHPSRAPSSRTWSWHLPIRCQEDIIDSTVHVSWHVLEDAVGSQLRPEGLARPEMLAGGGGIETRNECDTARSQPCAGTVLLSEDRAGMA